MDFSSVRFSSSGHVKWKLIAHEETSLLQEVYCDLSR